MPTGNAAADALLRTVPTIQAAGLAADNYRFARKKKKKAGDFVKQGTKNVLGGAFIDVTADFI